MSQERQYTHEFQVFGDRLTRELNDEAHRGLYMKLAKYESKALLESALFFVRDAKTNKPAALFMWRLQQLKGKGSSNPKEPKLGYQGGREKQK